MKAWICSTLLGIVLAASSSAVPVSETARGAVEATRSYGAAVRSCDMGWALDSMYPPLKRVYAEQFSNRSGREAENARRIMGLTEESPEQALQRYREGLRALREHYVKMGQMMQKSGVKIESFSVREPMAEYILTPHTGLARAAQRDREGRISAEDLQGGNERSRLVVLPTTLVVSCPDRSGGVRRVERRAHIYAIRDEVVNGPMDRNGFTTHETKINKWYFVDGNTDINTLRAFFPDLPLHLPLPSSGERVLQ